MSCLCRTRLNFTLPLPPLRCNWKQMHRAFSNSVATSNRRTRLTGKTVLITGASTGIGRSTALAFAQAEPTNLQLILLSRRQDRLEEVKHEIENITGNQVRVCTVSLDVGNLEEAKAVMDRIPPAFKEIDILINNAGVALGALVTAPNIKQADILTMFHTNVLGLIAITQSVLPAFIARGRGDIINVGSIAGRDPYAGASVYCATKAALRAFTASIRSELVSTNVRVMEISPGQTRTDLARVRFSGDQVAAEKTYEGYKPLEADDVAELILFAANRPPHVILADSLLLCNEQATSTLIHRSSSFVSSKRKKHAEIYK